MSTIFIVIWILLTLIIEALYHKNFSIEYHNLSKEILQELMASGLIALATLLLLGYVFIQYVYIIVPLIILILSFVIYKKMNNPKILITGLVLTVIAFGGLKYFNYKMNSKDTGNNEIAYESANAKTTDNDNNQENQSTTENNTNYDTNTEKKLEETSNVNDIIIENIKSYINAFVDDVNYGQASSCLNYFVNNGELYNEQVKNIPEIAKSFKEKVESIDIKNIKQIDNNKYSVQVIEKIGLSKDNSDYEIKEFHNSYTVVKLGSNYLIESMNLNAF